MSKSLFEITQDLFNLHSEIEAADGVISDEQIAYLEIAEADMEEKLYKYMQFFKHKKVSETTLKEEAKRLTERAKSMDSMVERIKANVVLALNLFGDKSRSGEKIKRYDKFSVWLKSTKTVVWDEVALATYVDKSIEHYHMSVQGITSDEASDLFYKVMNQLSSFVRVKLEISCTPLAFANLLKPMAKYGIHHKDSVTDDITTWYRQKYDIPSKQGLEYLKEHYKFKMETDDFSKDLKVRAEKTDFDPAIPSLRKELDERETTITIIDNIIEQTTIKEVVNQAPVFR